VAHTLSGGLTHSGPACVWLVAHPLELCHARGPAQGETPRGGLGGNGTPLALRDRLGGELAKLVAKDDDPHRIDRLARIRFHHKSLQTHEIMVCADALDIHLLPNVGAAWVPQGTQTEVMTPGKNEKHYLAGALHLATGTLVYCLGPRKNTGLFRDLLTLLDATYPARQITRISVIVDNYCIHKAKAVELG